MFEDDTRNPFMPGDDLPKPREGDILVIRRMEINADMPERVRVIDTYDSLAESWDPVGENAWMQRDINDIVGFKGHWYADCVSLDEHADDWTVASYEVASIEPERIKVTHFWTDEDPPRIEVLYLTRDEYEEYMRQSLEED